jgi:hypothetical protein
MAHIYLHFHPESRALLLTDTSASGTHVQVGDGEMTLIHHQTVEISGRAYIRLGDHRQFEFDIQPTARWEGFDRLFARWLRSVKPVRRSRRRKSVGHQSSGLLSPPPES